jgi:hypothetical protein
MIAKPERVLALAALWGCWTAATPSAVKAQALFEVIPTSEIPQDYSSWSLFLVCNPAWIIQSGDKGVAELFNQYKAFGHAIGPKNLAIWFWKEPAATATAANTDTDRSSTYCEKYKLLPSESPHVLVTTRYPNDPVPGDRFVVRLNGLAPHDSALALTNLADQLLVTGLNQTGLDASVRWRKVFAAVGSAVINQSISKFIFMRHNAWTVFGRTNKSCLGFFADCAWRKPPCS